MIQRIQTVFLLLAFVFIALMFKMTFAEFITASEMYIFKFNQIKLLAEPETVYLSTLPISILLVLIISILVVTVVLFRKRMLQIRLCVVNIVLSLGLTGMIYYYIHFISKQLEAESILKIGIIFPVIVAILLFLSIRGIAKDEALVRSVDRIR